jgi:hypothetical protein
MPTGKPPFLAQVRGLFFSSIMPQGHQVDRLDAVPRVTLERSGDLGMRHSSEHKLSSHLIR